MIIYIWIILGNWALKCDMEMKNENLLNYNQKKTFIINNCTLCISQSWKKKDSPFLFRSYAT